jgi:hypothetical protein
VDPVDQIPVRLLHILEADVSQDTSVVDEDIDAAECVDSCLDDGVSILDWIVVGDRLAASGADLLDDLVCGLWSGISIGRRTEGWKTYRWARTLALEAATQVVHNDVRAATAKEDGILATQSTTSTRDDNGLAVVSQLLRRHDVVFLNCSEGLRLRSFVESSCARGVSNASKQQGYC